MKKIILKLSVFLALGILLPTVSFANASPTCSPSISSATIGQEVIWSVSGLDDSYGYSWNDENNNPMSVTDVPMTKSYTTAGTKTASVVIGNGEGSNQTIACSTNVVEKKIVNNGGGGSSGGGSVNRCTLIGNIDGDTACDVDIFDFNLLMLNWGSTVSGNKSDLNKDEIVDILDLNILMLNWTGTL
jgi:hypothetical protein